MAKAGGGGVQPLRCNSFLRFVNREFTELGYLEEERSCLVVAFGGSSYSSGRIVLSQHRYSLILVWC